jgi:hypothetical protein
MSTIHREWSTIQKMFVRYTCYVYHGWNHRKGCSTIPVVRLHTRICVNGGRAAAHRLRLPRGEAAAAGTEPVSASRRRTTSTWLPLRSSSCPCCSLRCTVGCTAIHGNGMAWRGGNRKPRRGARRNTIRFPPPAWLATVQFEI